MKNNPMHGKVNSANASREFGNDVPEIANMPAVVAKRPRDQSSVDIVRGFLDSA
jgi:hypothetical protein